MDTVTYPKCEGCGGALTSAGDGYIVTGCIHAAELDDGGDTSAAPLIGEYDPNELGVTAWCSGCFVGKLGLVRPFEAGPKHPIASATDTYVATGVDVKIAVVGDSVEP